jgi:hypothetical protein
LTIDMRRLPPKCDPEPITQSDEETDDPLIADHRNFYAVEKWIKDASRVDRMLFAGSNLDDLPSAAHPANHPTALACVGAAPWCSSALSRSPGSGYNATPPEPYARPLGDWFQHELGSSASRAPKTSRRTRRSRLS